MKSFESFVLTFLLNSLWQIPLVFLAAWFAARWARHAGPRMEHRIWVSALLLETILPLCHLHLNDLWHRIWQFMPWLPSGSTADENVRVVIGDVAAYRASVLQLPAHLLLIIVTAYLCSLIYFAVRLAWRLWKTKTLLLQAEHNPLNPETAQSLDRCSRLFDIPERSVQILTSSAISGPVTVGIRQRVLLLPPWFIEKARSRDLDAVFAHEFAHLRRQDFAKNLLYELLTLPVAYHPLSALTRSHLAATREMICDAMAAEKVSGRIPYAHSLLRLASLVSDRAATSHLHAIGIFDANTFERRIMYLKRKHPETRSLQRLLIAAFCALIAVATCTSALAFRIDVNAPANAQPKEPLHVNQDTLTMVVKKPPVYPEEAKKQKIQGKVMLSVSIGKDGAPVDIQVAESEHTELTQSALDAVREWRWQPYLLNGNPVEVKTMVTIIYSLKP